MRAVLEFNLPEDENEHRMAIHARNFVFAFDDFWNWLRDQVKHVELENRPSIEQVREKFYECLNNHHLSEFLD